MTRLYSYCLAALLLFACFACGDSYEAGDVDIVESPEQIPERINLDIRKVIEYASSHAFTIDDSTRLSSFDLIHQYYDQHDYQPTWSMEAVWKAQSDSLFAFIKRCRNYGLFESDYHFSALTSIKERLKDSAQARNALLWTTADLLLTDAFFTLLRDVKEGRIPIDTLTARTDTLVRPELYKGLLMQFMGKRPITDIVASIEPKHEGYVALRSSLPSFLDTAIIHETTYLQFPFKDSMIFVRNLQRRLYELDYLPAPDQPFDTLTLRKAISAYQKDKKLKVTGRINQVLINNLNMSDLERFKIIALTLDKYKQLPDSLPATYVWVNVPAYRMKVVDMDSIALESKVIVGTQKTPTPEIVSRISNFVTYPQWTVPYSIIFKEMLPQIQRDVNYLDKQNLMVVDRKDNIIDPYTVNWAKLSKKNFPYQLRQRQGDDNSLGVMKFNFKNKHSVYLHDTNARWMFQKTDRSLSHGCVRVQKWKELAEFLVRYDSVTNPMDSISNWITRKEKHIVYGFTPVPIFIRYFTCDVSEGRIKFYEDIYGTDRLLREKYFRKKL